MSSYHVICGRPLLFSFFSPWPTSYEFITPFLFSSCDMPDFNFTILPTMSLIFHYYLIHILVFWIPSVILSIFISIALQLCHWKGNIIFQRTGLSISISTVTSWVNSTQRSNTSAQYWLIFMELSFIKMMPNDSLLWWLGSFLCT